MELASCRSSGDLPFTPESRLTRQEHDSYIFLVVICQLSACARIWERMLKSTTWSPQHFIFVATTTSRSVLSSYISLAYVGILSACLLFLTISSVAWPFTSSRTEPNSQSSEFSNNNSPKPFCELNFPHQLSIIQRHSKEEVGLAHMGVSKEQQHSWPSVQEQRRPIL